jgi:hypothetical protein
MKKPWIVEERRAPRSILKEALCILQKVNAIATPGPGVQVLMLKLGLPLLDARTLMLKYAAAGGMTAEEAIMVAERADYGARYVAIQKLRMTPDGTLRSALIGHVARELIGVDVFRCAA